MAGVVAANRLELLQIADAVARDKSIDKQVVLAAMEEAMQRAAKSHYGTENDIKVDIDPKTGETHVSRYLHVVELVENDKTEISLVEARRRNPDAQVGDIIAETLPPVDFNRRQGFGDDVADLGVGIALETLPPVDFNRINAQNA